MAADAILLRAQTRPDFQRLTLESNPLDNAAHEYYLPRFDANVVFFTANDHAPVMDEVASFGTTQTSFVVPLDVTDADGDWVFFTAQATDPAVSLLGWSFEIPSWRPLLHFSAEDFAGTAQITVTAHDGPYGPGDGGTPTAQPLMSRWIRAQSMAPSGTTATRTASGNGTNLRRGYAYLCR